MEKLVTHKPVFGQQEQVLLSAKLQHVQIIAGLLSQREIFLVETDGKVPVQLEQMMIKGEQRQELVDRLLKLTEITY